MNLITNRHETMYTRLQKNIENAKEIFINVSFLRDSGMKFLIKDLIKAKNLGKKIKIITSDYMKVTEPTALYRLVNNNITETRIFNNKNNISFHPKTYIFKNDENVEILIGSSNISYSALLKGVEWNYNISGTIKNVEIQNILNEFDYLYEENSFELSLDWLRKYEKNYKVDKSVKVFDNVLPETSLVELEPIKFQIPALYELSKTREEGYKKALVVVGTGLGKTYLAAFDSLNFKRVLFIVHREEILNQAMDSFKKVHGNTKTYGFFKGDTKDTQSAMIFASVSTLGKKEYLNEKYFPEDYFDYIVIDEVHHGTANNYQNLLEYFKPKFLLGLTATPERNDNGDVYKICDYNIAYECDFVTGINNEWLTPFKYYGIYDDVNYENIPWRSGKYDLESLENALIVEERANKILKKYKQFKNRSTLGFCASVKHCEFMTEFFNKHKIKAKFITGNTSSNERKKIIEELKNQEIEIIFTVDVFNEGVDIPCVNTVLFLRPTESYTIFLQQLGRGLRTHAGKEFLRVLDFVGNYKGAELRLLYLTGKNKKQSTSPLNLENLDLPSGCSVNFDLELLDYFEKANEKKKTLGERLVNAYMNVQQQLENRPSIMDIFTYGEFPVHTYLQTFKTWWDFLDKINSLSENEKLFSENFKDFLKLLEKTSMTKSYKIPLLLSLFENGLKESVSTKEIGEKFMEFYKEFLFKKDLNNKKHADIENWTLKDYTKLALENPVHFIITNKESSKYFTFENDRFILNKSIYEEIKNNKDALQNILDRITYRNKNYFSRKYEL
ncbi:PLD-like domain-containing protein [Cetobacterium ceti]|uniref:PLD-like domain-containing protein n=1 Tax=Cetobacterium ceti TaxID=180163 RepID=A0A1T4R581_9FUSO|nr:DEAD/DEAH box helicase family protein [Cetobacterium ceti]SKA11113.1 PLD-like domain-containing protein [Cetobacterium ceti]